MTGAQATPNKHARTEKRGSDRNPQRHRQRRGVSRHARKACRDREHNVPEQRKREHPLKMRAFRYERRGNPAAQAF